MAYTKTVWSDRQVQYPLRFTQVVNGDTVTLTPSEGTITSAGTPITAANLNKIETQYEQVFTDLPSTGYFIPTFFNGWVEPDGDYPSRYHKDSDGVVHYYVRLINGSTGANVVPFTFPSGYRPPFARMLLGYNDADPTTPILFHILPNGEVKFLRDFSCPPSNFIILQGSFKSGS